MKKLILKTAAAEKWVGRGREREKKEDFEFNGSKVTAYIFWRERKREESGRIGTQRLI